MLHSALLIAVEIQIVSRQKPGKHVFQHMIRGQKRFEALTRLSSLDLEEGVLLEDAIDAGLIGASFFSSRVLSKPFSRGECAGLPRGEEGS